MSDTTQHPLSDHERIEWLEKLVRELVKKRVDSHHTDMVLLLWEYQIKTWRSITESPSFFYSDIAKQDFLQFVAKCESDFEHLQARHITYSELKARDLGTPPPLAE
jgi:gluconate kinase